MSDNEYYVAKLHTCNCCEGTGRYPGPYQWDFPESIPCDICNGVGKLPEWIPLTEALAGGSLAPWIAREAGKYE